MSKYQPLWEYVASDGRDSFVMTWDEILQVTGFPVDHALLTFKKELPVYGYAVGKISMKKQTVEFHKVSRFPEGGAQ